MQHIKNCFEELQKFSLKEIENILNNNPEIIFKKDLFKKCFIEKLTLNDYKYLFVSLIFKHFLIENKELNKAFLNIFNENKNYVDYFAFFEFKVFVNNKIKII